MAPITPCLWFDGTAHEAVELYCSIFKRAKITSDSDVVINFELDGTAFMALNGGPQYALTPAISMLVSCETQEEIDHYWAALGEGGQELRCGWITDRFGVSWQIIPVQLGALMGGRDPGISSRVREAMMTMVKLDIAALEAAATIINADGSDADAESLQRS